MNFYSSEDEILGEMSNKYGIRVTREQIYDTTGYSYLLEEDVEDDIFAMFDEPDPNIDLDRNKDIQELNILEGAAEFTPLRQESYQVSSAQWQQISNPKGSELGRLVWDPGGSNALNPRTGTTNSQGWRE